MTDLPFISVIIPVKNGEGRIEDCLESVRAQDYPKDRYEIIVADGGSTDRTVDIAKSYGAVVIDNPKIVQGAGRNEAMKVAKGELVAFSEDDCVVPPGWLETGRRLIKNDGAVAVGGPTPLPETSGAFAKAANLVFMFASGAGYSVQSGHGAAKEVDDLPGGNAIYRKDVLEKFLPIREGLAEDVDLGIRMRKAGVKMLLAPEFFAWHHKKETPRKFFRQIRRFGIGRARLGRIHPEAVRPLHWLAALAAPAGIVVIATAVMVGLALPITAAAAALAALIAAAALRSGENLKVALLAVWAFFLFLIAWSAGFLSETVFPEKMKP